MSQVLSLRLNDSLLERLDRFARRQGNGMSRTKAGQILLEESLRETEFAHIEFRDSPLGRQPYMKGSGLAVWEVIMIAKPFEMNVEKVAQFYPYPVERIKAAFNYYEAYTAEVDQAIEDNNIGYERMKGLLPNLNLFEVPHESQPEGE